MARRGFKTQPPKEATLIVSVILWLVGLLGGLHIVSVPGNYVFWSLVIAGGLLILGSLLDGL